MTERLFAAELSTLLGRTPATARRFLARLERLHGDAVVGRAGRARFTTWAALERVTPLRRPEPAATPRNAAMERLALRLPALEERVAELEALVHRLRGEAAPRRLHAPRSHVGGSRLQTA